MSSYVSVLTIVAFSTERYLSICYPLYLYTMSGLQRAIRIIICLWLVSFFSALPFSIYTKIDYEPDQNGDCIVKSAFCGMLHPPIGLAELSFLIFFIVPMLIIAVQYTMMAMKISQRTSHSLGRCIGGSVHRDRRNSQSHRVIIRMLAAVVVGFFVCWAPFHGQRLLYNYEKSFPYYEYVFYITGILYYLSSTLNPILYNVMSNKYRTAFRDILCGGGGSGSTRRGSRRYHNGNGTVTRRNRRRRYNDPDDMDDDDLTPGGLTRNSTFRETTETTIAKGDQYLVYRCSSSKSSSTTAAKDNGNDTLLLPPDADDDEDDFDTKTLVSTALMLSADNDVGCEPSVTGNGTTGKFVKITSPTTKNTVFYELNFKASAAAANASRECDGKYFDFSRANTETCI